MKIFVDFWNLCVRLRLLFVKFFLFKSIYKLNNIYHFNRTFFNHTIIRNLEIHRNCFIMGSLGRKAYIIVSVSDEKCKIFSAKFRLRFKK